MGTHSEAGLISLTSDRAYEAWYPAHKPCNVAANRLALHDLAAKQIGSDTEIRFLEFGVHSGNTMKRFASLFSNPNSTFIGFDSFLGLPECWAGRPAGHFSTSGKMPVIGDKRVVFIKGWFQNTTPAFFERLKGEPPKTTLVHFDADIYTSTLFLLSSLWWHIHEYFFIMDEFIGEELAATRNFVSAFPVDIEFYSRVDNERGQPVQIFGRLRNARLAVEGVG